MKSLGERTDVLHPVASRFDINQQPDIQLIHMGQKAGTRMPAKARKGAFPEQGRPDVGAPPVKPDVGALASIEATYKGGRRPALVLKFIETKDGNFICALGEVRLEIHAIGRGDWKAFLVRKTVRWSRKKQDFKIGWRQLLSGQPAASAHDALHSISQMDGWFLCEGYWRPLAWVYRSVITVGLEIKNGLPKTYERGLRAGFNLPHLKGYWKWEADNVAEVIRPLTVLPNNAGMVRYFKPLDKRSELAYDQNVGDRIGNDAGKPKYGRIFYTPQGEIKLDSKIVKAPVDKKPSGKDINPRPKLARDPAWIIKVNSEEA